MFAAHHHNNNLLNPTHNIENISCDISEISHCERLTSPSLPQVAQKGRQQHRFGGIHINYILYFFIPLLIFACLYCLHMAVSQKQERPYPHATITNTACHYPQDIVFRFLMLPAGSFICLIYFIAFRWLEKVKEITNYPFGVEKWLFKWAVASVFGFYCAIGTIDSAGYPSIHGIGAVFFFVILFLVAGVITFVMRELHNWNTFIIAGRSITIKLLVFGYIVGVAIYCLIGSLLQIKPSNDDDIYLVIIEWNLTIGGLVWLLTFVVDWKPVFLTLKGDISKTIKIIPISG